MKITFKTGETQHSQTVAGMFGRPMTLPGVIEEHYVSIDVGKMIRIEGSRLINQVQNLCGRIFDYQVKRIKTLVRGIKMDVHDRTHLAELDALQVMEMYVDENGMQVEGISKFLSNTYRIVFSDRILQFQSKDYYNEPKNTFYAFAIPAAKTVVLPEHWDNFSETIRASVLLHEIGHIKHGHWCNVVVPRH